MITISQGELLKLHKLWADNGAFIDSLMQRQIQEYEKMKGATETEWQAAKQFVEREAKKQALIDFKKLLTSYEHTADRG